MNLRILKKKSKQARPIIEKYYDFYAPKIFLARAGENYHGMNIKCRHIKKPGKYRCECHYHPLDGTPMWGDMQGYYEPEWHEECLLSVLQESVIWGDKPEAMPPAVWEATLKICGITQKKIDEHSAWVREGIDGVMESAA